MLFSLLRLVLASAALALPQPGAGQTAPGRLPSLLDRTHCDPSSAADSAIVVCGRRSGNDSPYRIPTELRDTGPIDARHESRVAAQREEGSLDRFGAQTVGPGGSLQHSRQVDCEWRAARQALQGRQADCTVRIGPDQPDDWQRH